MQIREYSTQASLRITKQGKNYFTRPNLDKQLLSRDVYVVSLFCITFHSKDGNLCWFDYGPGKYEQFYSFEAQFSYHSYAVFFWRLNRFCRIVPALLRCFLSFWADFVPSLSFLLICRTKLWKTSSTKCRKAADVSKNAQSNSRASACPSSVVTSRLLSKSILFATRTIGMSSHRRTRSICFLACEASLKLCLSVMEYIMINPSPLRIYCSLIAVNSCCN